MHRFNDLTDAQLQAKATTMLRRFFGYTSFRPRQLEVITAALRGRDTVVLMPTGGGKSITFQIPALILDGITVVVSPLLSLMRDQVDALIANGIPAATINSLQSDDENRSVTRALGAGHIKLLYISPERLLADMPRWRPDLPINLIAIDEAHCISRWGHDFRPDYTRLAMIRDTRPDIPIIALTATADRLTRDDIARQLRLQDPLTVLTSFDRPNLSLKVETGSSLRRRIATMTSLIDRYPSDTGIVYCLARKTTESVSAELKKAGYAVEPYHAAMSADRRMEVQSRFRSGELQAVVATVAFGMGIDKSNIRWIVHNNMPSCIESYYQEIGRAGRDGLPSKTVMFYSVADLITLRKFADESGQAAVNMEKLKRMSQYAEARVCRRRMLLSYFGETMDHDCGNCDVCLSPPVRHDASIPVRKALSAIIRTGEEVGANMLVDILRGSSRADLVAKGYHNIKTYGAGRDLDAATWQSVILQMIQLGIVDIAYDRSNKLFVTPYGREILFSDQPVMLARPDDMAHREKARKAAPAERRRPSIDPMTVLRDLRNRLAAKEGIASYMVISDPALMAIAAVMPASLEKFAAIEGISDRKAVAYWRPVAKELARHFKQYKPEILHSRYDTLFLLRRGNSPAEIASLRRLSPATVYNHLFDLYEAGAITDSDLPGIVDPAVYRSVINLYLSEPKENFYDSIEGRYPDGLVRFILAIARKKGHIPPAST